MNWSCQPPQNAVKADMDTLRPSKGSLCFRLFGIPVVINPLSWLVLLLLGGGLGISDGAELSHALVFVVAGMLCLLVHEFGHALVGRKLGAGPPLILISGMGGVTYTPHALSGRWAFLLMVLAGPFASLLPAIVGGLLLGVQIGDPLHGLSFALLSPLGLYTFEANLQSPLALALYNESLSLFGLTCYSTLFFISIWWSLFNILPIFPLDGGQALGRVMKSKSITFLIGFLLSGSLALLSILSGYWFNMMITGYLAWINWQCFRQTRRG